MKDNKTETIINTQNKQEAKELTEFINTLDPNEKKEFLLFLQGI